MTRIASALALAGLFVFAEAGDSYAGSAGRCGGTGGNQTKNLTCPTGLYVAGIAARGGVYIDEFSIVCRKIPASGAVGELGNFMSAGPGGGTTSKSNKCDKEHAVTKIGFRSGEFVDSVSYGLCSKRSGSGWGSQGVSSIFLEGIGGPGGIACSLTCPGGEAMYKVTVKYGSFVDSIRAECRR